MTSDLGRVEGKRGDIESGFRTFEDPCKFPVWDGSRTKVDGEEGG